MRPAHPTRSPLMVRHAHGRAFVRSEFALFAAENLATTVARHTKPVQASAHMHTRRNCLTPRAVVVIDPRAVLEGRSGDVKSATLRGVPPALMPQLSKVRGLVRPHARPGTAARGANAGSPQGICCAHPPPACSSSPHPPRHQSPAPPDPPPMPVRNPCPAAVPLNSHRAGHQRARGHGRPDGRVVRRGCCMAPGRRRRRRMRRRHAPLRGAWRMPAGFCVRHPTWSRLLPAPCACPAPG